MKLTRGDIEYVLTSYWYCTYCKQEVEPIDKGYPISGSSYHCPICDRYDEDVSNDGLGLVCKDRPTGVCKIRLDRLREVVEELKKWVMDLDYYGDVIPIDKIDELFGEICEEDSG
ncbi:MAG: hypothetical protein GF411_12915 [Candidatus Lokiarchaeota archaeon]|nr:hypothetical protein [Candidatus Lokiarchaeota archaeon]